MIDLRRKKFGIRFQEFFFPEPSTFCANKSTTCIKLFIQCSERIHKAYCKEFRTVIIDLNNDQDKILSGMQKTYRYEINKAINTDCISFSINNTPKAEDIFLFCNLYNSFSARKELPNANITKFHLLARKKALVLSFSFDKNQTTLVFHALIKDQSTMRLLYSGNCLTSASSADMRSLVGRSNKALHYREMLEAKKSSHTSYDLGGISLSQKESGIERF